MFCQGTYFEVRMGEIPAIFQDSNNQVADSIRELGPPSSTPILQMENVMAHQSSLK
jgi:hypothetical protein